MSRPRLKSTPANGNQPAPPAGEPVPLPPLNISGVVVTKKDLAAALQAWMPVQSIEAFEDGELFYLILDAKRAPAAVPAHGERDAEE